MTLETVLWAIAGLALNTVVGGFVWVACDDKEQSLFTWYRNCPPHVSGILQPLALNAWPFAVWFWYTRHRR